jgi:hypothetical protein
VPSDADKVAEFRAFMRMRRTMPDQFSSYAMRNFTRFLLKVRNASPSTSAREPFVQPHLPALLCERKSDSV